MRVCFTFGKCQVPKYYTHQGKSLKRSYSDGHIYGNEFGSQLPSISRVIHSFAC